MVDERSSVPWGLRFRAGVVLVWARTNDEGPTTPKTHTGFFATLGMTSRLGTLSSL
jgi:hypothetical protein